MTTPYEPCVTDANGKCTRWSHDHPAEDAHPAPTPAPVAVPEGIHRGIEPDTEMGGVICSECGWHLAGRDTMQAGEMDERQRQHDEHHAPRPEPVVAPLPSEAACRSCRRGRPVLCEGYVQVRCRNADRDPDSATETPLQALAGSVLHDYDHGRWITHADLATKVRALADWVLRLVPEDDEDTVRVPRVALIELNAAVMDRKRDLVDAIEEFNDEVRS